MAVDDRWRIAAYIRALQLSENAPADVAAIRIVLAARADVTVAIEDALMGEDAIRRYEIGDNG